jgi:hypothetical protein
MVEPVPDEPFTSHDLRVKAARDEEDFVRPRSPWLMVTHARRGRSIGAGHDDSSRTENRDATGPEYSTRRFYSAGCRASRVQVIE